jgi:diaminopimelate epimerase
MQYDIYSGAGNDFIMINNFDNAVPFEKQAAYAQKICDIHFPHIDGVIFTDKPLSTDAAIRMNYYNRDGSYGAMCGNGARCTARFAYDLGLAPDNTFKLEAVDKIYTTEIKPESIKISFPPPVEVITDIILKLDDINYQAHYLNVGSDHIVLIIDDNVNRNIFHQDINHIDVNELGRRLRFHADLLPAGANVNFIELQHGILRIRTYEKGVERETLACGTGILSSGIVSVIKGLLIPPVELIAQSAQKLFVDLKYENGNISELTLEGGADKIATQTIDEI